MHKTAIKKESEKPESIHASEFDCQGPLRLYERLEDGTRTAPQGKESLL